MFDNPIAFTSYQTKLMSIASTIVLLPQHLNLPKHQLWDSKTTMKDKYAFFQKVGRQ
jgi:hypothetical protein